MDLSNKDTTYILQKSHYSIAGKYDEIRCTHEFTFPPNSTKKSIQHFTKNHFLFIRGI